MLFIICICLSLWVGYLFGVNRQINRGLKELEAANTSIVFWKDIAERQSMALRKDIPNPPSISELDAK